MILRPIQSSEGSRDLSDPVPAWLAVEKTQSRTLAECWMITQPAHAALAGEIAAELDPGVFPGIDNSTARAIALHDAGWGPLDAADVQSSRASAVRGSKGFQPHSFINAPVVDILRAWTGSIEVAGRISDTGAYIVSEHFRSIAVAQAEGRGNNKSEGDLQALDKFVDGENTRQKSLSMALSVTAEFLQRLVAALQFSDLLSLYLCCGVESPVEFPQKIKGENIKLHRAGASNECWLKPSPFTREHHFRVSGIRHPKSRDGLGVTFSMHVTN